MDDGVDNIQVTQRKDKKGGKIYGTRKRLIIKWIYIASIIGWVLLLYLLRFYRTSWVGYIILSIPIFVYLLGIINSNQMTVEVEENVFGSSYLSIGMLIIIPFLAWMDKRPNVNNAIVSEALILAIILSLVSLVEIWVPPKWLSIVRHLKSIFQMAALSLLVFGMYMFYVGRTIR